MPDLIDFQCSHGSQLFHVPISSANVPNAKTTSSPPDGSPSSYSDLEAIAVHLLFPSICWPHLKPIHNRPPPLLHALHKLSDPFAPLSPPFIRPVPSCRRPKQSKVSYVQTCNHPSKQFLRMGHFCRHFPFILRNLLHRHVHPHAQVRRIVLHPDQELELVHYVLQGSRTRR